MINMEKFIISLQITFSRAPVFVFLTFDVFQNVCCLNVFFKETDISNNKTQELSSQLL